MGSLPYGSLPHDDTKGGARPPLESPAEFPNILSDDGYSRGCVTRSMFRLALLETSISLTGRQAEYR